MADYIENYGNKLFTVSPLTEADRKANILWSCFWSNGISERQVGAGMYNRGLRVRIVLGHLVEGKFVKDLSIAPFYVREMRQVNSMLKNLIPYRDGCGQKAVKRHYCDVHYIDENGDATDEQRASLKKSIKEGFVYLNKGGT